MEKNYDPGSHTPLIYTSNILGVCRETGQDNPNSLDCWHRIQCIMHFCQPAWDYSFRSLWPAKTPSIKVSCWGWREKGDLCPPPSSQLNKLPSLTTLARFPPVSQQGALASGLAARERHSPFGNPDKLLFPWKNTQLKWMAVSFSRKWGASHGASGGGRGEKRESVAHAKSWDISAGRRALALHFSWQMPPPHLFPTLELMASGGWGTIDLGNCLARSDHKAIKPSVLYAAERLWSLIKRVWVGRF